MDYSELRDHNLRVGELSHYVSKLLNMDELEQKKIKRAGELHDIGKIVIPEEILFKKDKLNNDEYTIMKRHSIFSSYLTDIMDENIDISSYVRYHHENYNGTGYERLRGENIPIGSRIIRIVDVFDALTNDRVYRRKLTQRAALDLMVVEEDKFDIYILKEFLNIYRN